jgi:hypothetical protein
LDKPSGIFIAKLACACIFLGSSGIMWNMRNSNKVIGIGIAIIVIPLLGLPSAWKTAIFVVLGLWLCSIGFFARKERSSTSGKTRKKENVASASSFVENQPVKIKTENPESISADNNYEQNPQA